MTPLILMLENEKQVDASQSIVWCATADVERWPQWMPTVENVTRLDDGPFDVGSTARIKQRGLPAAVWRVTAFTRGDAFTWETRIRGIRMVATHELIPSGTGTKSILRLEVSGIVAVLLWPLLRASARKALDQENTGLKAACEAVSNPS